MLGVGQIHVVRHRIHVQKQSIRQVARELHLHRTTVRKYLRDPVPKRVEAEPRARPVFERMRARVDALLKEWSHRTTQKQRITGSRLHEALVEEDMDVGVTVVRDYLRELRRQKSEVHVPLVHRAGDEAQVDFFVVTVDVDGERRAVWMFLMRLMYSGRDFAWLYERCDQIAFLDGHVRAFAHFDLVPQRSIYDNLKPAVRKIVLPKRELTDRFASLVRHYLYEACFARPGKGNDKGGVEARGKGVRLQHLTPIPRADSLAQISAALLARIAKREAKPPKRGPETRTVLERFEDERPHALPLPAVPFDARKVVTVSAGSQCKVLVASAWYSVPSRWKMLEATAYVGPDEVEIVCRGERVSHRRQGFGGRSIKYRHYLPELAKKPQAVRQVAAELVEELGEPYGRLWRLLTEAHGELAGARCLARILGAVVDQGEEAVAKALEAALATKRVNLLGLAASPAPQPTVPVPASLAGYDVESARVADFDALLLEPVA